MGKKTVDELLAERNHPLTADVKAKAPRPRQAIQERIRLRGA